MCKALIIGAGGVGTVVTQKIAANPVFTDVMLASRTKSKCDAVAAAIGGNRVKTRRGRCRQRAAAVRAVPCVQTRHRGQRGASVPGPHDHGRRLECGCNYLDTANYEPKDEAHFEYSWQWAYQDRFKAAGTHGDPRLWFRPGRDGPSSRPDAAKHHFDEIHLPRTSSTATPATTAWPSPRTSTPRSTSAR